MNLEKMSPMDRTQVILDAISKKQEVMAANVTNANTPGYTNSPLETQLSEKIGPNPFFIQEEGAVDLKKELIEMQKNSMYYATAVRRMTSVITQIRTVTNVGK